MSWKKYFTPVAVDNNSGSYSPISGGGRPGPARSNYSSYLPDVYAGSPNRIEKYMQYDTMDMDSEEGDDEEEAEEEAVAFEAADEEVEEATEEEVEESKEPKSQTEIMREYTDKVSASMGDNGANTKSPVAGKNDMGGTSANIAKGGSADEKGTGASAPKSDTAGNVNVPGGKAAKSMTSAKAPAKGDDGANKKSTIGS